jgi:Ca2+/Na+ antiporter
MAKFTAINDGNSYLSKDIEDYSKVYRLFILIMLSGFSLLIFNLSLFSLIFYFLKIDAIIQIVILIPLVFYVYQDFLKMDIYEKEEKTDNVEYMTDILEKYTITNAIDRLPFRPFLHGFVFLITQIITPLTSLKIPKIQIIQHWIYRTKELNDLIRNLITKKEGITLEQLTGYGEFTIEQILENTEPEHVKTLIDKTPKENFPYIFDSEYYPTKFISHQYQKKVSVAKIIMKRKGTKTMGYMFFHLFKGVQMIGVKPKRSYMIGGEREKRYETQEPVTSYKPAFLFYIILIGEKNVIKSLETLLLTNSSKVPPESLMFEL